MIDDAVSVGQETKVRDNPAGNPGVPYDVRKRALSIERAACSTRWVKCQVSFLLFYS